MADKKIREHVRTPAGGWVLFALLCLYIAALLFPYFIALNGAFRSNADFSNNIFGFSAPTLENIQAVLTGFKYDVVLPDGSEGAYYFDGLLVNSVLYALGSALSATFTPCVVAYCAARFDYPFSKFLVTLVYVLMAVHLVGTTPASIEMTQAIGIYDSIPGAWFLKLSFLGMYFLIFHSGFRAIPRDYNEAARIDGANNFKIFFKIMIPLVSNTLLIVFLLYFVSFWSDYTTPLYYLPNNPTLALALLEFNDSNVGAAATTQMAACLMLALPSVILFICFSEKFTGNLQMGGIKG